MRYLIVLLLAGCTHAVTLHPRGGGEPAIGSLNDGSERFQVTIDAKTYSGDYVSASSFTFGRRGGYTVGNQKTALLTGPGGTVRCEFVLGDFGGGNGVCVDAQGRTYDMLIK